MNYKARFPYVSIASVAGLLFLLTVTGVTLGAATNSGSGCTDSAKPLATTADNEGEPSIKIPQGNTGWLVSSWTSSPYVPPAQTEGTQFPIGGQINLGQLGPDGHWKTEVLASGTPQRVADSWIDTSPDGSVYISYISDAYDPSGVSVRHVTPGQPAGPALSAPRGDHPALAVDQSAGKADHLYLAEMAMHNPHRSFLLESNSGGQAWQKQVNFPYYLQGYLPGQPAPTIASGGKNVEVAWIEGKNWYLGKDTKTAVRVARFNTDTGQFNGAQTISIMPGFFGDLAFGGSASPSLSVVRSGKYAGRIYLAWTQRRTEKTNATDIYLSRSDDGKYWSAPRQVNDDGGGAYQVFPSVAAEPDGSAYVVWMDTRNDPSNNTATMYGARVGSVDTPGSNVQLTTCPTYAEPSVEDTLGDYFSFDASQGNPVIVFPNMRRENYDSDVFWLDQR